MSTLAYGGDAENGSRAPRLLSPKEVSRLTSLSRSTLWRLRGSGDFPQPIRLSNIRIAWLEVDVLQWVTSRVEKRPFAS